MPTGPRISMLIAVLSVVLALLSISSVVPRIRLVEAIALFATAFGAGAGLVHSVVGMQRDAERGTTRTH